MTDIITAAEKTSPAKPTEGPTATVALYESPEIPLGAEDAALRVE